MMVDLILMLILFWRQVLVIHQESNEALEISIIQFRDHPLAQLTKTKSNG